VSHLWNEKLTSNKSNWTLIQKRIYTSTNSRSILTQLAHYMLREKSVSTMVAIHALLGLLPIARLTFDHFNCPGEFCTSRTIRAAFNSSFL